MDRYFALFLMSSIPCTWAADTSQMTTKLQTTHPIQNTQTTPGPVVMTSGDSAATGSSPMSMQQLVHWLDTINVEPTETVLFTTQDTESSHSETTKKPADESIYSTVGLTETKQGSARIPVTSESDMTKAIDLTNLENPKQMTTEPPIPTTDFLQRLENILQSQKPKLTDEHFKAIATNLMNKHEETFHGVNNNDKTFIKVRHYFSVSSHSPNDELPSPNEFFKWIDSIHPTNINVNKPTDTQQTKSKQQATEKPSKNFISPTKTAILSAVISCVFLLFVIIFAMIYCRRQKKSEDIKVQEVGYSADKVVPCIYQVNDDNAFMGIPANNNIWKEIQMLSATAPVVLPASDKI